MEADFEESEVGYRVRLWVLFIVYQCPASQAKSVLRYRSWLPPLTIEEFRNVSRGFSRLSLLGLRHSGFLGIPLAF